MKPSIDRVAFTLFGIDVMWYGIIIATGVLCAIFVAQYLAEKENISRETILDIVLYSVPVGIIGARLYYVIFEWDYYKGDFLKIIDIRQGGLAIYGGIIAGSLTAYFYCRLRNLNFLMISDCFMPAIALAQSIGRWGNFINQEAYGRPTNLPWAIIVNGQKVHPTFFYESFGDFLIFIFLGYYFLNKKKNNGEICYLYLILYGLLRAFVEGLRTDSLYIGMFRVSQVLSILFVFLGIFLFYRSRIKMMNNKN